MTFMKNPQECCGCGACANRCPQNCIKMVADSEGFLYPKVDEQLCIACKLCEMVCPFVAEPKNQYNTKVYAGKNKNGYVRMNSSSGGSFSLLAADAIKRGGIVFGAAFNTDNTLRHIGIETEEGLHKLRGSKYLQSIIDDEYNLVKKYLEEGRFVLFSGTPCQVTGLKLYLDRNYSNLLTVDVVCHGVPSPLVFSKYIQSLERKYSSTINYLTFRDKSESWKNYSFTALFANGTKCSVKAAENVYMKGFLSELYLRPSCHNCKCKFANLQSDITLGDYWGVESKFTDFDDDIGVSLILINSDKGQEIFNTVRDQLDVLETDLEHVINNNPCIVKSAVPHKKRLDFFLAIDGKTEIEPIIEKMLRPSTLVIIKTICLRLLRKSWQWLSF